MHHPSFLSLSFILSRLCTTTYVPHFFVTKNFFAQKKFFFAKCAKAPKMRIDCAHKKVEREREFLKAQSFPLFVAFIFSISLTHSLSRTFPFLLDFLSSDYSLLKSVQKRNSFKSLNKSLKFDS